MKRCARNVHGVSCLTQFATGSVEDIVPTGQFFQAGLLPSLLSQLVILSVSFPFIFPLITSFSYSGPGTFQLLDSEDHFVPGCVT
jgi:hypothetical protein